MGLPVCCLHLLRRLAGIQNVDRDSLCRQQRRQFFRLHRVGLTFLIPLKEQKRLLPAVALHLWATVAGAVQIAVVGHPALKLVVGHQPAVGVEVDDVVLSGFALQVL